MLLKTSFDYSLPGQEKYFQPEWMFRLMDSNPGRQDDSVTITNSSAETG
jgi:hypothetical protein